MFLTMFFKTQNIGQTMHLTMLIAHPYPKGAKDEVKRPKGPPARSRARRAPRLLVVNILFPFSNSKEKALLHQILQKEDSAE